LTDLILCTLIAGKHDERSFIVINNVIFLCMFILHLIFINRNSNSRYVQMPWQSFRHNPDNWPVRSIVWHTVYGETGVLLVGHVTLWGGHHTGMH